MIFAREEGNCFLGLKSPDTPEGVETPAVRTQAKKIHLFTPLGSKVEQFCADVKRRDGLHKLTLSLVVQGCS